LASTSSAWRYFRVCGLRKEILIPRSPSVGRKYQVTKKTDTSMVPESSPQVSPWGYQSVVSWSPRSKAYHMEGGRIAPNAAAAPLRTAFLLASASTVCTVAGWISPASFAAPSASVPVARRKVKGALSVGTMCCPQSFRPSD
jgi:hypothetical protein